MPKRSLTYWATYYGFDAVAKTVDIAIYAVLLSVLAFIGNIAQTIAIWFCLLAIRSVIEMCKDFVIEDRILSVAVGDAECVFDVSLLMLLPAVLAVWVTGADGSAIRLAYWYWPAGIFVGLFAMVRLGQGVKRALQHQESGSRRKNG